MASPANQPIVEQIRQNLLTTLQGISVAAGYFRNLSSSPLFASNEIASDTVILSTGDARDLDGEPLQRIEWYWEFVATAYVIVPQNNKTLQVDQLLLQQFSDIANAVNADRQRGNLAVDTYVRNPRMGVDAAEGRFRVEVPIWVRFRTLETDQTVRG